MKIGSLPTGGTNPICHRPSAAPSPINFWLPISSRTCSRGRTHPQIVFVFPRWRTMWSPKTGLTKGSVVSLVCAATPADAKAAVEQNRRRILNRGRCPIRVIKAEGIRDTVKIGNALGAGHTTCVVYPCDHGKTTTRKRRFPQFNPANRAMSDGHSQRHGTRVWAYIPDRRAKDNSSSREPASRSATRSDPSHPRK